MINAKPSEWPSVSGWILMHEIPFIRSHLNPAFVLHTHDRFSSDSIQGTTHHAFFLRTLTHCLAGYFAVNSETSIELII